MKATVKSGEYFASITVELEDGEAAKAFQATLPKSLRASYSTHLATVTVEARTSENGANGGVNEAGIKRLGSFMKKLDAQGAEYVMLDRFAHRLATVEAFRAELGL